MVVYCLQEIAVPIHIDAHLPDYIVRTEMYERGMTKRWNVGQRFRMYFGGKVGLFFSPCTSGVLLISISICIKQHVAHIAVFNLHAPLCSLEQPVVVVGHHPGNLAACNANIGEP